jgi:hypothetical protein
MREFLLAHGHVLFENPKERQVMKATHAEVVEWAAIDYILSHWSDIRMLRDHTLLHLEKVWR